MPTQPTPTMWPADHASYPHTATARIYGRKTYREAVAEFTLKALTGKVGSNAAIIINRELGKDKGSVINTMMLGALSGAGVTGNNPLFDGQTSAGEAVKQYNLQTHLNTRRNSVYNVGELATFYAKRYKITNSMKSLLSEWLAGQWETDVYTALDQKYGVDVAGAGSLLTLTQTPHENWYFVGSIGNQTQSTWALQESVEATTVGGANDDFLDMAALESIAATAKLLHIRKLRTEFGPGWILVVHPYVAHTLRIDPDFRALAMTADIRGVGNRMFKDFVGMYAGITILESERVSTNTGAFEVYRNYLLGSNALSFAMGSMPSWHELLWDFDAQQHFASGQIYGMTRNSFVADDGVGAVINQSSMIISSNVSTPTF